MLPATIIYGFGIIIGFVFGTTSIVEHGFSFQWLGFIFLPLGGLFGLVGLWASIITKGKVRNRVFLVLGMLPAGFVVTSTLIGEPTSVMTDLVSFVLFSSLCCCLGLGGMYLFGYRNGT